MNTKNVIVVILAYGLWGNTKRSPKEVIGYGMYLNECANAIRHLATCGYKVSVILCGGAMADGLTEAKSMFEYFESLSKIDKIDASFFIEERSLSTPANIWLAYSEIERWVIKSAKQDTRVIFLCDTAREFKVRWLVKEWLARARIVGNLLDWSPVQLILSWPKPEVIGFNRPDIVPKSTKIFQFMETLAMILVPIFLEKRIMSLRE